VETVFRDASDEQVQLEVVRNDLIRTVPELRRGMLLEITRPHALLTEAIARRLGRPTDDEDARLYAGAVMGVLMTLALEGLEGIGSPEGHEVPDPRPTATVERLVALIDRIERVVHLPPE
jgi:hypothetical protein